jgi:aldehyde dehydrogenase (NAD+)
MKDLRRYYIDGQWVAPEPGARDWQAVDPSTEEPIATIALATKADVDKAVAAAARAFESFGLTSIEERIALLERLKAAYKRCYAEMAEAIRREMGAPKLLAEKAQAAAGLGHIMTALSLLREEQVEVNERGTAILSEPVGVCALITPWNWPMNQIMCKVAPALAAGCTMVLKPSELAPLSAHLIAEIIDEAGVPPGVFNLIDGDAVAGTAMAEHPQVDMISLTGSTRAGAEVSRHAAASIKRVSLELGGKSANIILPDADLAAAVKEGVEACFRNSGQSCNAPTRMLVPADRLEEALAIARAAADEVVVGPPDAEGTDIGPQANEKQWKTTQSLIEGAVKEGAPLVTGGPGRPPHLNAGFYTRPTVFGPVDNQHMIARTEVFGPVLTIIPYDDVEQAIAIANDTPYGLSAYVQSADIGQARQVARRLRAGMVHLNGAPTDISAPFGGYKQSGNGREWGQHGLQEFLEIKAIMGYGK